MSEWKFTLPVLPPSCNALHSIIWSQRRVELKPEVRKFRSDIKQYVPRVVLASVNSLVCVELVFYYRHYHANGKMRRMDTHNGVKVILDVIAEKCGFDDCRVKSGSWDSVDSVDEKVEVVLRELR